METSVNQMPINMSEMFVSMRQAQILDKGLGDFWDLLSHSSEVMGGLRFQKSLKHWQVWGWKSGSTK
jgi:hypothetical protein